MSTPLYAAQPALEWPCQRTVISRSAINMPPYSFFNAQQELTGYRIEFMQQIFGRLGCKLEILTDSPWKRSLMLLESGDIDVLMNASKSTEREAYALFSNAYEQERVALYVKAGQQQLHATVRNLQDIAARGLNVGVIRGNYYGELFASIQQQKDLSKHVLEAIDKPSLYFLLLKDRVQLYLDYYPNGVLALRDENLDKQIVLHPMSPVVIGQVHFMFSRHSVSPAFVRRFDQELLRMQQDGSVLKLQQKYQLLP
ncbi:MAG: transporter substrate-binding domain-containing protein [Rheinheimera sp.]|nr:transporter substrate-binding domain-containing protein [Rheinheimera sp.]